MSTNDEDQVRAMLEAMGVSTTTDSFPSHVDTPVPVTAPAAVSNPVSSAPAEPASGAPTMSISEALSTISGITERAPAVSGATVSLGAVTAALGGATAGSGREMTLSTLVHLLGLSTSSQVDLLETQVDALMTKVTTILLKLDRIGADLSAIKGDAAVDRIDFQISEIRALLKRVVPAAAAAGEIETRPDASKSASGRAKILTSDAAKAAPKKPETKIVEKDNLEEFSSSDDAAYQADEGQRIRNQTK